MMTVSADVYTIAEVAAAAGADEADVRLLVPAGDEFIPHGEALRIGRLLAARNQLGVASTGPLFSIVGLSTRGASPKALILSSTLHVLMIGVVATLATVGVAPVVATALAEPHADPMRLVFLATPGPGGGGGGGGLLQKAPPPKAQREGHRTLSSPLPQREPPKPIDPAPQAPEPKPTPIAAEPLPPIIAPIVSAPADTRTRVGVLDQTTAENETRGSGRGGGAGSGTGTGIGEGEGAGIGPGSGGGTGGGPYRPGSGITPPQIVREVKADYTEQARRQGIAGEVLLEIVVRRDGTVGDVKLLQGLAGGLNERAIDAVRQWRFTPARRQGTPVDVIVEVGVEFRLR